MTSLVGYSYSYSAVCLVDGLTSSCSDRMSVAFDEFYVIKVAFGLLFWTRISCPTD